MRSTDIHLRWQPSAIALAIQLGFSAPAWSAGALPQGATVLNGQVGITQSNPNSLQIQASAGSIVNWQQFSIGAGNQVRIALPNASSAMLNRVVGGQGSQLLGSLQSNGRIFLINPNGIVVGSGARIDTNSFIASTLDMADADFLGGKLRFLASSGAGAIRNDGVITAGPGGRVALIAPDIQNTGIIQAPGGQILLAAGRKLEISSLDFEGVTFEVQAPTDAVLNLGKLLAENGAVSVFAGSLRQSGDIRATRMVQDADGSIRLTASNALNVDSGSTTVVDGLSGGSIRIETTGGTTHVAGTVSATGSQGPGGSIQILGNRVALDAGARIDASGAQGGGAILVGGDFQGKNTAIQNAERVYVDADARLNADATQSGDGGKVVVWADGNTRYLGSLSVRGGAQGGNGGNAEVSGKQNLSYAGSADLAAPAGKSGTLLLDPLDILVSDTGGILTTVVDQFSDFPGNVVTISPTTLNKVKGNVTLQAERDIYFNSAVALTTAGAGLAATAGGTTFNAPGGGQIYLNQGITTTGGNVTLRAVGISGSGTITTAGGAVDIKTSGNENYTAAISSGGGAVSLESVTGSVSGASVNAGSGTVSLRTTTGSISGGTVTGGTVSLSATGGSVYGTYVNAATRIDASSSSSSIYLLNYASQPLRVGTLSAPSTISLTSSNGFEQAAGGSITAPAVYLATNNSTTSTGTLAAPLAIASPQLTVQSLAAGAHINVIGNTTLSGLTLQGSLAALSNTTVTGAANLGTFTLGNAGGNLSVTADSGAVSGFGTGLSIQVSDAGITAPSINLLGGKVTLTSVAALSIGTLNAAGLYASAQGAVSLGNTTSTDSFGINVTTNACTASYVGCTAFSPISANTLTASGGGSVALRTYDNGDITISGSLNATSATLNAGSQYYTSNYPTYFTMRTANNINVAATTLSSSLGVTNSGIGDITLGSLAVGGSVSINAGGTYKVSSVSYPYYQNLTSTNNINVTVAEPATPSGSFQITDSGIGNISVSGAVNRPSGSISLTAANGSITSANDLSAYSNITVSAGSNAATLANVTSSNGRVSLSAGGNLTVGQVSAGSLSATGNSGSSLSAGGDLSFLSVSSNASAFYVTNYGYGSVTLSSTNGSIKTRQDNTSADISSNNNVTLTANNLTNGDIGDTTFTNPLDIVSGTATTNAITLSAGKNMGASGKVVNADTVGTLGVTSLAGRYFVAAQSPDAVNQRSLTGLKLSASAAGMGSGGTSTLTSSGMNVSAVSDGSIITIGDVARSSGALNELRFTASNGGLNYGDINLSTTGYNQLFLSSAGILAQLNPVSTNNISAGYVYLNSGSNALKVGNVTSSSFTAGNMVEIVGGNVTAGALAGPGVKVNGANLTLASVTSTGTSRGYPYVYSFVPRFGNYNYVTDEIRLTASGTLTTPGNITSATSAYVSANGLSINGGSGTVNGGHTYNSYYADTVSLNSGTGALSVGVTSAYDVTAQGASLTLGNATADRNLSLGSASTTSLTTGTLNGVSGVTLNAGAFSTGVVTTTGALNITANSTGTQIFAPSVAMSATGTYGTATITAANGIDLSGATFTAKTATLNTTTGNINAPLAGTTNLTLHTAGQFTASSTAALTNLYVTADGAAAGASGGSTVTDASTNQVMKVLGPASALALTLKPSVAGIAQRYDESNTAVSNIALSTIGSLGASSSIYLNAGTANVSVPSLAMANGNLTIYAGGDISLSSVSTGSGYVLADSAGGTIDLASVNTAGGWVSAHTAGNATKNINVTSITSLGGSVSLTSDNGSITGTGALAIDMRNGAGNASGTLTLQALQGSIGSVATPLQTKGAVTLDARSKNDLVVDAATTPLTNLYLNTLASGTGLVQVTNSTFNFNGLGITRVGGTDLDVSGLGTATGAFSLTARDGNINFKSDVGSLGGLTLVSTLGDINIAASGGVARSVSVGSGLTLQAGRDIGITAGTQAGESVTVQSVSTMSLTAGRHISVVGGALGNAIATLQATSGSQTLNATGNVLIQGGNGTGSYASVLSGSSQSVYANNLSVLGAGDGSYAALRGYSQYIAQIAGIALIQGGSGTGAYAEVASTTSSQTFGTQYNYYYNPTDSISVLGGSGSGAYASLRSAYSQDVHSVGNILVQAGTGSNANAEIKAVANQTVGGTDNYYNTPTVDVTVNASSTGTAQILAGGNQSVLGRGTISVQGGNATGMTASIETTAGSQTVGSSSTSYNLPTSAISVRAGAGGAAWIRAAGSQTLMTGGDLEVVGGSATNATASIESTAGSQTIGNTYVYSNDPIGNIHVTGGTGAGAAAWIKAATAQAIDTGGDIVVTGGATGAYADVVSTLGAQTIGNQSPYYYDQTNQIALAGGTGSGAYARIASLGGSQNVQASTGIDLHGGAADGAGALLLASTGQTVNTAGALTVEGGTGALNSPNESGFRNTTSGAQSVQAALGIALTGGGLASTTWIKQASAAAQTISTGGDLTLTATTAGATLVSIESGAGGQTLTTGGAISLDNAGAQTMQIASGAAQTINTDSLSIVLGSTTGALPLSTVNATGNQNIVLNGVDTTNPVTPATLTVTNFSATAGSKAALEAGGNQTITMNYLAAGRMQVGDVNDQGIARVYAGGDQTIVAGEVLVQGGASPLASSTLSDGSTLNGKVSVLAGSTGLAELDPLNLSVVSNGAISVTSGAVSTASATVTAGIINMTATNGNMSVISGGAPATVTATSTSTLPGVNTFNLNASGGLTIAGGASITASAGGSLLLGGPCVGCTSGLVGPFTVTVPPLVNTAIPGATNAGLFIWTSNLASLDPALQDLIAAGYDLVMEEDGTITSRRRNLAQCY
jgi:filamentous hemagglutinin family protein